MTTTNDSTKPILKTALNLLSRREHSTKELSRKLSAKNFDLGDIKSIINSLENAGLLSHTRFVESFIHHRQTKGMGPLRIQAELSDRGISDDLIEQALNIADNTWFIEAQRAWEKRFKNGIPSDFKARAQQMRFLQNRGFTREQIESVFKRK